MTVGHFAAHMRLLMDELRADDDEGERKPVGADDNGGRMSGIGPAPTAKDLEGVPFLADPGTIGKP